MGSKYPKLEKQIQKRTEVNDFGPFTSCDMKWKQLPSNTATRLSSKSSASHEAAALRPMVLKTSTSHRDKMSSTPDRTIETYLPTNGSTHSKVSVIPSSEKKEK